jgi:hypothetical protein
VSNYCSWAIATLSGIRTQYQGSSLRQTKREFCGDVFVRGSANTVSAK